MALAPGAVQAEESSVALGRHVCVGHMTLELPASAEVRLSGSYRGIRVERGESAGSREMVDELGARAEQMRGRKVEQDPRAAALYRSGGVDPDPLFGESQLLGFDLDQEQALAILGYHDEPGKPSIIVELHRIYGQAHYILRAENMGADRYEAVREGMLRAASGFQPLHEEEIPEGPGFCVGDGLFVEESSGDVGGDATLVATFPEFSGVTFSIDVSGVAAPASKEGGLWTRIARGMGQLARVAAGVRTLRKGTERYAGRRGHLIAISVDDEGERLQKFFWSAEGVPGDARQPTIEIQLMAGASGPSPLGDDEVGALWDSLLAGLRQRPGAI